MKRGFLVIGLAADTSRVRFHAAAVGAMLAVAAASYAVLRAAPAVTTRLGSTGEAAVSKLMGLIILCVRIQFLINGVMLVAAQLRAQPVG